MILKGLTCGLQPDSQVLESLNTCTTCGICTENCPAGVNPSQMIESARRELVSLGAVTREQADLSRNIFASGNTFGDVTDRLSWLKDRDRSLLRKKADYVYFVGCMNSYRYTETAAKTFALLNRFGATLLPAEKCCGSPLLRTGFDAERLVDENCRQIAETGAGTVITGCAGCYTTLKNSYPQDFRVQSIPEFLAENISELDISQLDLTVTYHDPCHLGRHNQIYEQPRRVIEAICRLKEMKTSGKAARCCGGGGGVRAGYRDLSLQMARKRLEDVPEGVDYIVTSCPLCIRNLRDAGAGEKVIDLVDLAAMAVRDRHIY
jgi:fumarate reductase (CoM/CoB) subunit B